MVKAGVENLVRDGTTIKQYQDTNNNCESSESSLESMGSISSAEEKDLQLLMSGKYSTMFEAMDHVNKWTEYYLSQQKKEERQRKNKWMDYICCRAKELQPMLQRHDVEIFKNSSNSFSS
jgi:DNA/RNA endonuclease G (NUC1)